MRRPKEVVQAGKTVVTSSEEGRKERAWSGPVRLLTAASCVGHVTMQHVHPVGLEGLGWLCKLSEHLMARVWPSNPEVPAFGLIRHFAKALDDGNLIHRRAQSRHSNSRREKLGYNKGT